MVLESKMYPQESNNQLADIIKYQLLIIFVVEILLNLSIQFFLFWKFKSIKADLSFMKKLSVIHHK